jgi:hypothetical protein
MLRAPAALRRLPEPSVVYTPELLLHGPQHAVHFRPQRDPVRAPAPTAWLLGWLSADWCRRASMQIRAALTLDVAVDRAWGPCQFAQEHEGVVACAERAADAVGVTCSGVSCRDRLSTWCSGHAHQATPKLERVFVGEPFLVPPLAELGTTAFGVTLSDQVRDGSVHAMLLETLPGPLAEAPCGVQKKASNAARLLVTGRRVSEAPIAAHARGGRSVRLLRRRVPCVI